MFKARFLTSIVLAPLAIYAVFGLSLLPFTLLLDLVLLLAAWEWANLSGYQTLQQRLGYLLAVAAGLGGLHWLQPHLPLSLVLGSALLFWLLALVWVLRFPATCGWRHAWQRALIGFAVLLPCWFALVQVKSHPQAEFWLLCLLLLVWGADVGAYIAGKSLGRNKLAPKVSPGKTREGLLGGLLTCFAVGVGFSIWLELDLQAGVLLMLLAVCTGLMSVLGDLFESMLKRERGIKDSSRILPGHGGILDRIDSLTAAAPFFVLWLYCLLPA
ncbi:phosphatidate cytidylyltransferase [Pontibacter sp. JAM-7]|uniref:phosphatidate cytidylyltransferase n=1 Tax=Pontibacter sp. JAM-7 TaxID=3366581 RepID=UPI003AF9639D